MASIALLPGDPVPTSRLPVPGSGKPLSLGPGLRHVPPDTLAATTAGLLCADAKKNALWLDHNGGRYIPRVNDLVIATIHHSSTDTYHVSLSDHTAHALLPQLAFEGATKKTRPILQSGALVYARVTAAPRDLEVQLECVSATTGKADGLGPLKGGSVFSISLAMARRLMMGAKGGLVILDELSEQIGFEVAVGRNGFLWVDAGSVKGTLAVGKAVVEVDERGMGTAEQKKFAKKVLKGL